MAFVVHLWCACTLSVAAALPLLRREHRSVAYVLYGGVSRVTFGGRFNSSVLAKNEDYVPLRITGALMQKHIFRHTPDADIFIHSWVPQLKNDFLEVFKPTDAIFENNTGMIDRFQNTLGCQTANAKAQNSCIWQAVSCIYAWQQAMNLMLSYEKAQNKMYDIVMLLRPDIVHFDDLDVTQLFQSENTIYHDYWLPPMEDCGDFHFIMSRANAIKVAAMYQNLEKDSPSGFLHDKQCFKNEYMRKFIGAETQSSGFIEGDNIMLYRRMGTEEGCRLIRNQTRMNDLYDAGFAEADRVKLAGICKPGKYEGR